MPRRFLFLVASLLISGAAQACGYCVEDKIASVYDHALVTQTLARKHHVAFFHVDGALPPGEAGRRLLEAAAASTAGIDRGSARIAVETLTLAVAFDPHRSSLIAVQTGLEKNLAAKKLTLLPLRVIDGTAQLSAVKPK